MIPMLKLRLARPSLLLDIGRLEALHGIREEQGVLVLGACTTHDGVARVYTKRALLQAIARAGG